MRCLGWAYAQTVSFVSVCLNCRQVLALFLLTYTFSSGYTINYSVVSEAPSVEASLSDVLYVYFSALMSAILYDYVSILVGLPPPRGPYSL